MRAAHPYEEPAFDVFALATLPGDAGLGRTGTLCSPISLRAFVARVALVDVAHWASEFPWCAQAAGVLTRHFGPSLAVRVSTTRTDPWNIEDGQ
jgi:putative NIF3 family GTP cyclohydrolase 1 type 2